ncbi:MAG: acyltransferase family protein [Aulosira sp. ZfuVER01]|nr:acyltransferase [Aulosira sp. ZfuVER01]MDZ8000755.1 acyltransferase [Aulosira sp. DedVER01a]MDZ8055063.1 acyltransferase [Aulosira sp. ZfuCHP01]
MIQKRINSFDGLRAIAIFLVLLDHAKNTIQSKSDIWNLASIFIANSSLGVRLFFVLSGYLITIILLKETNESGSIDLKRFYVRRAIRLFPSLYCFILVVFILNLTVNLNITLEQFIAAATFTWNYLGPFHNGLFTGNWFFGHLWTLSLEEQFYLLWPLLLLLGINKSRKLSLVLILSMPIIRVASYFLFPSIKGYLNMMLHTSIDSIMVGCLMAILTQFSSSNQRIYKLKGFSIVILLIWPLFITPILDHLIRGYLISIGLTIDAIILGILIAWLHANPLSYANRLLSIPFLVYVGKISYSLYIWQQLFLTNENATISGIFPYNLGFSFLAGMASYYLIEKPCLKFKDSNKISGLLGLHK